MGANNHYLYGDPSLSSLSSVQNFSVKDATKERERCYMGICLPVTLTNVFPTSPTKSKRLSFYYKKYSEGFILYICSDIFILI